MIKIKEKRVADGRFGFFPGSSVLLSPFAKILSGLLIAGLFASSGFALWKTFEIKKLEREIDKLTIEILEEQNENIHLTSELDKCKLRVEDQNRSILQLVTDSQKDIERMNRENEKLNNLTEKQKREIDQLKNTPAPQSCEESMEWLRDNLNIFGDNQ